MPHSYSNKYLRYDGEIDENVKPILSGNNNLPIRVSNNKIFLDSETQLNGDLIFTNDSSVISGDDITLSAGTELILKKHGATGLMSAQLAGEAITITASNGANSNLYLLSSGSADADVVIANSAGTNADSILIASIFGGVQIVCGSVDDVLKLYGYQLNCDFVDSITLDSASGEFIAKKGGTEFSAANSSYAGMILGYTKIQNDSTVTGNQVINMTTSLTVLQTGQGTNVSIAFVAPPSGNVEISMALRIYASSISVEFALSDNATYNEIDESYTYDAGVVRSDETDTNMITTRFVVTGLTAGSSYTYYIAAAEGSSGTAQIYQGRNRATGSHYPPIIVKAVALPATIVTGE